MRVFNRSDFIWRGLDLCAGRRKLLTLVPDPTHPHLYRIEYPNGWLSSPANITRAKEAAYGHAHYLLMQETPTKGVYSGESVLQVEVER